MRVTTLKVTNLRAIKEAAFRFQPRFNLIVGVNGVGKTSVLDALGACLSAVVIQTNQLALRPESFLADDIRVGADALSVECGIAIGTGKYAYLVHKPRERSAPRSKGAGKPREQVHDTPERSEFIGEPPATATGKEKEGRPLAILFSTSRAVPSDKQPSKGKSSGGYAAAYAEAFSSRELRLAEFANWMRVQEALKGENQAAKKVLGAFERAVQRFLPGYSNLRVELDRGTPVLKINRGKSALRVRQLSDGERGTLALVLDLTRRLAQANPHMGDPAKQAEAVVLIDEIDLHLHPKWQRLIVGNLTAAFPKCQFIATTHSPQVIGEVAHERIQIIADGEVYSPSHSFGVDSSRVLEEIMGAAPRTSDVADVLAELSRAVGDGKFKAATKLVDQLAEQLGEDDPEVTRARTLLGFMEGDK
jgi:predicted ATP-binding protein involved in virulence